MNDPGKKALEELAAQVTFTLSDVSRLLRKEDVQGVCPHPDDCFYESDRVRCGPCAVKASAVKGVEIDDTYSHLPEVCRLRREVKAAEARATAAEGELSVIADHLESGAADSDAILHTVREIEADRDIFKDRATASEERVKVLEGIREGLEMGVKVASEWSTLQHIAHDIKAGVFPERTHVHDAIAAALKALAQEEGR